MIRVFSRILTVLFLLSFFTTKAQRYYDDAQLWVNIYLEKKVNKHFSLHLNQQDRFVNNINQLGQSYADIGITYKFRKNIKLMVDYVYAARKKDAPGYKNRHTFYSALILAKEFGYWRISYRNMFQCRYKNPMTSKTGYIPYLYDRNKITIKYQAAKRLDIYVAEELNIPLNNPQVKGFSRSRSTVGMYITTRKNQQLELYYIYQQQLQNGDWYHQDITYSSNLLKRKFVCGIGYQIQF
jgi:hypothetical protein